MRARLPPVSTPDRPGAASRWVSGRVSVKRAFLATALLLAAPCALASDAPAPTAQLFSSAYRQIEEYYLDPVSLETLTAAGLSSLDAPDDAFVVTDVDHQIVLSDHGVAVARLTAPGDTDTDGWGRLIASAIATGRAHSPPLAAEDDEAIYQEVFDGLLSRLDRFTRYAGREKAEDQRASRDGFGGIGVTLDYTSGPAPRISSVVADGPSSRAGLQVDDRIVAIDGTATAQMDQHALVERLRGPVDSRVLLTVSRPGKDKLVAATLTRALIVQPTVTTDIADGIATFRLDGFNVGSGGDLGQAVRKARETLGKGFRGAILDLRDNPGGLLDQAAMVASLFLDHGDIVSTRGRHPTATQYFAATAEDRIKGAPLVVLVNGGSASAAEIVAAALQDDGRAVLVGTSSFGKGTVQMVLRLPNTGELTLTWARLFAPSGYLLHQHGVIPTFCTDRPVDPLAPAEDDNVRLQHIIDSGLHPTRSTEIQPRATLSEAAWTELRQACPSDTRELQTDAQVAKRLILDPALYAQALSLAPVTVAHAGRPTIPAVQ